MFFVITAVVVLLGSLAGCQRASSSAAETSPASVSEANGHRPLEVVVTVGMVADLVRQIGGDRVSVVQLMGAGVDPHLYKPTRDDVAMLMNADLVFYSGLFLEGKLADALHTLSRRHHVVAATDLMDRRQLLQAGHGNTSANGSTHYDPHVWMDISLWSECIPQIERTLVEIDPEGKDGYESRAKAVRENLMRLDQYAHDRIATIPETGRVLVTSHDAFHYFGRRYGVDVQGVQGISTESEAGLQRIAELIDMLIERHIHAVFVESSVPAKSVQALIDGAASRKHSLVIGGELYSDAMGLPGTYEGTYEGMMDHNITTVVRALGGDVPARGLNGRLTVTGPEANHAR